MNVDRLGQVTRPVDSGAAQVDGVLRRREVDEVRALRVDVDSVQQLRLRFVVDEDLARLVRVG